ncbi:MAG TPA: hypothetical protein GX708_08790 [Gallicola sp.]|nr:hypothetical protein [Gallicola sp.]
MVLISDESHIAKAFLLFPTDIILSNLIIFLDIENINIAHNIAYNIMYYNNMANNMGNCTVKYIDKKERM